MDSSEMGGAAAAGGERGIKLFGVQIMLKRECSGREEEEEVLRKSKSMGDLASCQHGGAAADQGYLSDGGGLIGGCRRRNERKRGVPWTEEEHRTFLAGLKRLGKGDWRGISREYVRTRTPTQVASHAQKYFLRQSKPSKKKRRSSLFDVVPDKSVSDAEIDPTLPSKYSNEDHQCQDNYSSSTLSFVATHAVDIGAEASQEFNMTADRSRSLNPQHMNAMVGIVGSMKDQVIPFSNMEHFNPTFHKESAACIPDFLKLSSQYPHCTTRSAAMFPTIETSDLELRIAPPWTPNFKEVPSPGAAGAVKVL